MKRHIDLRKIQNEVTCLFKDVGPSEHKHADLEDLK